MNKDNRIAEMQEDIRAIKMQLEALMCESRIARLDTVSFLLELAYREASKCPEAAGETSATEEMLLTLQ